MALEDVAVTTGTTNNDGPDPPHNQHNDDDDIHHDDTVEETWEERIQRDIERTRQQIMIMTTTTTPPPPMETTITNHNDDDASGPASPPPPPQEEDDDHNNHNNVGVSSTATTISITGSTTQRSTPHQRSNSATSLLLSVVPTTTPPQRRHSDSFNDNSLLDLDEQSCGSERRRVLPQQPDDDDDDDDDDEDVPLSRDPQHPTDPPPPHGLLLLSSSSCIDPHVVEHEEKKEADDPDMADDPCVLPEDTTTAAIPTNHTPRPPHDDQAEINEEIDPELRDCLSATESEVASLDGLPSTLQHRLLAWNGPPQQHHLQSRERVLQTLDGIFVVPQQQQPAASSPSTRTTPPGRNHPITHHSDDDDDDVMVEAYPTSNKTSRVVIGGGRTRRDGDPTLDDDETTTHHHDPPASCGGIFMETCVAPWSGLWNGRMMEDDRLRCGSKGQWDTTRMKQNLEVPLAILDCSNIIHQEERGWSHYTSARVHSSLVRVARDHPHPQHPPSYGETLLPAAADPRMPDWIANQYHRRDQPPADGTYHLGQSRTVIVHEINRGNWTWCTAWAPDGRHLAVATDNHQLAVVDTMSSTVWRVRHDRKLRHPVGSNTTRSIRTIDWGKEFIAIGGTGNVVSILAPVEPYDILHDIPNTGFVGCVHWRGKSNVLAIGSRLDFVLIVEIRESEDHSGRTRVFSEILHKIEYKYWVNCVKFNADGSRVAVGDAGGIVSVYEYEQANGTVETRIITWFKRKDSILSVEWSSDGKWLYAGGEDCSVTVVDTSHWEIVHRIGQDRWVQCIASSRGSSHVAIGGVSSEISILDVASGWDSVMGIELKGLVPLSAQWHPRDQYLVLTGQDNTVLIVETTNARHVKGHHLHSISPIRAIEFSPDGRMAIVGNEAGVITFFSLSGTSFITSYELVIPLSKSVFIQWSLNGMFVVVGAASSVVIVLRKRNKRQGHKCPPNASGFSVKKVLGDAGAVHAIAIDYQSHFIAVSGDCTRIIDVRDDFSVVQEWKNGTCYANAWSSDGRWLAMMGKDKFLTIYDTSSTRVDRWGVIFSMKCDFIGRALAWGPLLVSGFMYLAYGGDSNEIYIMEIRTHEGTWETVLKIKRDAAISSLDWSMEGLLAAGIGNGTVSIIDLAYLQSGIAVNEMDYEWQRQALTCYTEIRRNRGVNAIKSLRWLPAAPGSDRLLAVGGTDGEVEIIDLTEQERCKGYAR